MTEKMHAMVLSKLAQIETRPLRLMSIDKPIVKDRDELSLQIQACRVCRSNLHLVEGDWEKFGSPSSLQLFPAMK